MFHARTKHIEVHYHFVSERVLSGEVELRYVHTDRQVANIFTKPLGSDNLQHFSGMLGLQHLDVSHLRGTMDGTGQGAGEEERTKGGDEQKKEAELTKGVSTSEQVGASGSGDRVKKDRVEQKKGQDPDMVRCG